MRRVGVFGGTFDPPHIGHLIIAQDLVERLALDHLLWIPTGIPPHKTGSDHTPADKRMEMVRLAVAGNERFEASDLELRRAGPSYTVDTLRELRAMSAEPTHLTLAIGWDMLIYLPQWHNVGELVHLCDQIATVARPGYDTREPAVERVSASLPGLREKLIVCPSPLIEVSATDIRTRVRVGLSIQYLVPDAVRLYIAQQRLYEDEAAGEMP